MTREEAILLLHDMKDTYDEIHENTNYEIGYEQMTALDMAIEALQADAVSLTGTMKYLTKPHNYCEVVRCKNCRHLYNKDFCSFFGSPTDAMDYCSHGERSEK